MIPIGIGITIENTKITLNLSAIIILNENVDSLYVNVILDEFWILVIFLPYRKLKMTEFSYSFFLYLLDFIGWAKN